MYPNEEKYINNLRDITINTLPSTTVKKYIKESLILD